MTDSSCVHVAGGRPAGAAIAAAVVAAGTIAWQLRGPAPGALAARSPARSERVAASTSLVVNEADVDQPGTDTAEFVELANVGSSPIDLDPYAILLVNGDLGGATIYRTVDLPSHTLAAGDYFVVCGNAANVPNCDLDLGVASDLIQNGAPDAVAVADGAALVDTVSYEGDTGSPYTEGSGAGLIDDPSKVARSLSRYPNGTDTDQNNVDLSPRCASPGEANLEADSSCAGATATAAASASPTITASAATATTSPVATITAVPSATMTTAPSATVAASPAATVTPLPSATFTPPPSATAAASETPARTATATSAPLAVVLEAMWCARAGREVRLGWRTAAELDHAGFHVWRASSSGGLTRLTATLMRPAGSPLAGASYSFVDRRAPIARARYWIVDVDRHGRQTWHGPVDAPAAVARRPWPIGAGAKIATDPIDTRWGWR